MTEVNNFIVKDDQQKNNWKKDDLWTNRYAVSQFVAWSPHALEN